MKRTLSFLLCVLFLKAQVAPLLAHSGGPEDLDSMNVDVTGTYSGTLIPKDSDSGTETVDGSDSLNSLGLFTVGIPAEGAGAGEFLVFTQGLTFSGTIVAVGNPANAKIDAILEGTYDYTDFVYDANGNPILDPNTGQPVTQQYQVPVRGTLTAAVSPTSFSSQGALLASNFGRITGSAEMGIIFGTQAQRILRYTVDGTKQSFDSSSTGNLQAAGTP